MIREATGFMNDTTAAADGDRGHQATPVMDFFQLAEVTLSVFRDVFG